MEANPLIRGAIAAGILAAYYGVVTTATRPPATAAPTTSMSKEHSLAVRSDELFRAHKYAEALPMLRQLNAGNVDAAKKNADVVLAKTPDNSDALLLDGMIARRQGDLPSAMKFYVHGTEVAPSYTDIFREL